MNILDSDFYASPASILYFTANRHIQFYKDKNVKLLSIDSNDRNEKENFYNNYINDLFNFQQNDFESFESENDNFNIKLDNLLNIYDKYQCENIMQNSIIKKGLNINTDHDYYFQTFQESKFIQSIAMYHLWKMNGKIVLNPDKDLISAIPEKLNKEYIITSMKNLPYKTFLINGKFLPDKTGTKFFDIEGYLLDRPDQKELFLLFNYDEKNNLISLYTEELNSNYSITKTNLTNPDLASATMNCISLNKIDELEEWKKDPLKSSLLKYLSLICYISCINSDIKKIPDKQIKIQKNLKTKIKSKEFIIGETIGVAIRRHHSQTQKTHVYIEGSGSSKAPHIRRGHFHHYWIGPKDDRKQVLKWLNPIFINCEKDKDKENIPITNKKVID